MYQTSVTKKVLDEIHKKIKNENKIFASLKKRIKYYINGAKYENKNNKKETIEWSNRKKRGIV